MSIRFLFATLILVALPAAAQRHKLSAINTETPEGKVLQAIMQEEDAAKKTQLLEQFATEHGSHDASGWVLTQLQAAYLKTGAADKALAIGEKLVGIDKDDLEAAYGNLKASETKKDPDGVLKWSGVTSEIARRQAQSPKPADEEEVEGWKQSVDYAKQVETYTEYALYAQVLQITDPAKLMQLVDALDERAPQSQYLPQVLGRYAMAARQANQLEKAVALGEKAAARNQVHEDMLLAMADYSMQKKQGDKVVAYGTQAAELMSTKPKPEGISEEEWTKKKNATVGLGHWMAGVTLADQGKYGAADKALRTALPLVEGTDQLKGPALFYLGLANYKLGQASKNKTQIADAARFSAQAAAIKGPYQSRAAQNLQAIRAQFGVR